MSKKEQIIEVVAEDPNKTVRGIADEVDCSVSWVREVKRENQSLIRQKGKWKSLIEKLENAREDPTNDHHFSLEAESLIKHIENDKLEIEFDVENISEESEMDNPLFVALASLQTWHSTGDYEDGAEPALSALDDSFELAKEEGWNSIAVLALEKGISLARSLSKESEVESKLEDTISYLEQEYCSSYIHLGNVSKLLDEIQENTDLASDDLLERVVDYCEERATFARNKNDFRNERNFLKEIIELRRELNGSVGDVRQRIADSYEDEAERKGRGSHSIKAAILSQALGDQDCLAVIDDSRKERWKREIRQANRKAAEEEMHEISVEVDGEEVEESVETFTERFRELAEEQGSAYALKASLHWDAFLPDYEQAAEIEQDYIFSQIFPRTTITPEGDPIDREPSSLEEPDSIPRNYFVGIQFLNHVVSSALYRLIDERYLSEVDFYIMLKQFPGLNVHDEAFLTDVIIDFFSRDYSSALHVGIARFEGAISRALESRGVPPVAAEGETTRQSELGGLFEILSNHLDRSFVQYLKFRYTDTSGTNLRNRVAHGQIKYPVASFLHSSILLFDIFRTLDRIDWHVG